jgi:HEAT repeat protein
LSFLFPSSTITLEAALRDATSTSVKARLRAVSALGDLEHEDVTGRRRAVAALTLALEDDQSSIRAEAAAALGGLGELAPVAALIARLGDGESQVRQQAAIALGTLRDRAGFAPLLESLRDGPADLRYQAVSSLAEIDAVAAYQPLVDALADRDPQVISAAAVALSSLGDGRAVQHLLPLLTRPEEDLRFEAAWALAELGDGRGRAELLAQLPGSHVAIAPADEGGKRRRPELPSTAHPGRSIEAVEAVARLGRLAPAGSDEDRRALARFVASPMAAAAPPEAVIIAARHVLALVEAAPAPDGGDASVDRAAAQRVLLAALEARKDPLRGLAVEQLLVVGGPWASAALEKLAASRRGKLLAEPIAEAMAAIAARAASPVQMQPARAAEDAHVDR